MERFDLVKGPLSPVLLERATAMTIMTKCGCGRTIRASDKYADQIVRCPQCSDPVRIPSAASPASEPTEKPIDPNKGETVRLSVARLCYFTCAWILLGWGLTTVVPFAAFWFRVFELAIVFLPLLVTAGLICWNTRASFAVIGRTGQVSKSLPVALVQIPLFSLLFYQVACHLGLSHFWWSSAPGVEDFFLFAVVHAFRAADLLDVLHGFGWSVQSIDARSLFAATLVLLFHLIIDLFVLRVLFELFQRLRTRIVGDSLELRTTVTFSGGVLAVLAAVYLAIAYFAGWQGNDLWLWPLDNALRVIDVLDLMQIFHLQLHSVPKTIWFGIMGFVVRLLILLSIGELIASFLAEFRLMKLRGVGLTEAELGHLQATTDREDVRAEATAQRERMLRRQQTEVKLHFGHGVGFASVIGLALIPMVLFFVFGLFRFPAERLRDQALGEDPGQATRALTAIRRGGPWAEEIIPDLSEATATATDSRRDELIDTLGYLGPSAAEPLVSLYDRSPQDRDQIGKALREIGPLAVPAIAQAYFSHPPETATPYRELIVSFGDDAIAGVAEVLSARQILRGLELLDDLSPYWEQAESDNPVFLALRNDATTIRTLNDPDVGGSKTTEAMDQIDALVEGELNPVLIGLLSTKRETYAVSAIEQAAEKDPRVNSKLLALMNGSEDFSELLRVISVLQRTQPSPWGRNGVHFAVPALLRFSDHPDPEVRESSKFHYLRYAKFQNSRKQLGNQEDLMGLLYNRLHDEDPAMQKLVEEILTGRRNVTGAKNHQPLETLIEVVAIGTPEEQQASLVLLKKVRHLHAGGSQSQIGRLPLLLVQGLHHDNPAYRKNCAELLEGFTFHQSGLTRLLHTDPSADEVAQVVRTLMEANSSFVSPLYYSLLTDIEDLRDPQARVRFITALDPVVKPIASLEWELLKSGPGQNRSIFETATGLETKTYLSDDDHHHADLAVVDGEAILVQTVSVDEGTQSEVTIFDLESGVQTKQYALPGLSHRSPWSAVSRDGSILVALFEQREPETGPLKQMLRSAVVFDLRTGRQIRKIPLNGTDRTDRTDEVIQDDSFAPQFVQVSHDGTRIAVVLASRVIMLDSQSGTQIQTFPCEASYRGMYAFSPNGGYFGGTCGSDYLLAGLTVWETNTGTVVGTTQNVSGFHFTTDSRSIITHHSANISRYRLTDDVDLVPIWAARLQDEPDYRINSFRSGRRFASLEMTPDGRRLLVAANGSRDLLIDTETGQKTAAALSLSLSSIVRFSPDGRYCVVVNSDSGNAIYYDLGEGK